MPNRPNKCPLCHSVFRNESGMKWHIAHRHEIPAAFDTLGKNYEAKNIDIQNDNIRLEQESGTLEKKLKETTQELIRSNAAKLEAEARVQKLNNYLETAMIALAARDIVMEERLGVRLPNPFSNTNKNS